VRGSVAGAREGSAVRTIAWSSMDSYLRSVVPREMPANYHPEALKAQAIAARTFAARYRERKRAAGAPWDVCDTTTCQVFRGVTTYRGRAKEVNEDPRTTAAVAATTSTVVRESAAPGARLAFSEFGDSNGGFSAVGDFPYQPAKADPYDGVVPSTSNTWRVTVPVTRLEKAFPVGALRSVEVLERDGNGQWGGRVKRIKVNGSARSVSVTGERFRFAVGLRSEWFALTPAR